MKNCSCPVCYEHQSANEYHRMTVHINEYHKLIEKIHERIEEREKEIEYLQNKDTLYLSPLRRNGEEIRILKSLLEDEK